MGFKFIKIIWKREDKGGNIAVPDIFSHTVSKKKLFLLWVSFLKACKAFHGTTALAPAPADTALQLSLYRSI